MTMNLVGIAGVPVGEAAIMPGYGYQAAIRAAAARREDRSIFDTKAALESRCAAVSAAFHEPAEQCVAEELQHRLIDRMVALGIVGASALVGYFVARRFR